MYYSIKILAFIFSTMSNVTYSQLPPEPRELEMPEVEMEMPVDEAPQKKFKRSKNMIDINPLRGKHTVKIGQQLVYSAGVHGSVGYTASANSSDSKALPLVRSFIEYDDDRKAEMSGGDSATKYFIFDAKKAGTYEIQASHYFRGDLENDFTIVITVEE